MAEKWSFEEGIVEVDENVDEYRGEVLLMSQTTSAGTYRFDDDDAISWRIKRDKAIGVPVFVTSQAVDARWSRTQYTDECIGL